MSQRIGIYSGTFNPIHLGHITFALQALREAKLDRVYLMPERHHVNKQDVAHFGHRVAMIKQAIKPHAKLSVIESHEISFSVNKTLPKLQNRFKNDQLVFLVGSDSLVGMSQWPQINNLLLVSELVVGIREGDQSRVLNLIAQLPTQPKAKYIIDSYAPSVSSSKIRHALRNQLETEGILSSVRRYSNKNWLYISLA